MADITYDMKTSDSSMTVRSEHDLVDAILRIRKAGKASNLEVAYESTDAFRDRLTAYARDWQRSVNTLAHAVVEQKKLLDYKDLYISLLSGAIREDEFETHAAEYTVGDEDTVEDSDLADRVARLLFHTRAVFTAAEISDLFGVTMTAAERAIERARSEGSMLGDEEGQRRLD